MKKIRCFFCLPLPPEQTSSIMQWMRANSALRGARWTSVQNLHVTLRFCGEQDEAVVRRLESRAGAALAEAFAEPLNFTTGKTGTFGRPPRVLWAGLDGDTARLRHLHDVIEDCCRAEGLEPDDKRFSPHLTLARFSAPVDVELLTPWELSPAFGRAWQADRVIFMRSTLTPAGPRYAPIKIYSPK